MLTMNVSIADRRPLFRYAPTPSGYLHTGNLCNFLLIWILAKANNARILLRIDDLDRDRYRTEYTEDIFRKLEWLELDYDLGPKDVQDFEKNWSQQYRQPIYSEYLQSLKQSAAVYACKCSRKDIESGKSCECDFQKSVDDLIPWRIRTEGLGEQYWHDQLYGEIRVLTHLSTPNFIVRKNNGFPSYQLASLIDDFHFGVTYIVRGEDLIHSTAAQLLLSDFIYQHKFRNSKFYHHPLVLSNEGLKLSKSAGDHTAISTAHNAETMRLTAQQVAVWLTITEKVESKEDLLSAYKTMQQSGV